MWPWSMKTDEQRQRFEDDLRNMRSRRGRRVRAPFSQPRMYLKEVYEIPPVLPDDGPVDVPEVPVETPRIDLVKESTHESLSTLTGGFGRIPKGKVSGWRSMPPGSSR